MSQHVLTIHRPQWFIWFYRIKGRSLFLTQILSGLKLNLVRLLWGLGHSIDLPSDCTSQEAGFWRLSTVRSSYLGNQSLCLFLQARWQCIVHSFLEVKEFGGGGGGPGSQKKPWVYFIDRKFHFYLGSWFVGGNRSSASLCVEWSRSFRKEHREALQAGLGTLPLLMWTEW